MKRCPFCAEEIQDEAIKCKHCHEFLDGPSRPVRITPPPAAKGPWYESAYLIVFALLAVGPLALPLVWIHPRYTLPLKCGISLATAAVTWGALHLTWTLYQNLSDQLQQMNLL